MFSGFGAFWISVGAIVEWFLKTVLAHHQGQALGLLLYGFTPLVLVLWLASFTSAVVVVALGTVLATVSSRSASASSSVPVWTRRAIGARPNASFSSSGMQKS